MTGVRKIKRKELIQVRKSLNLTQEEAAKMIGISQSHYSQIENGLKTPTLEQIKLLVSKLQIDVAIL